MPDICSECRQHHNSKQDRSSILVMLFHLPFSPPNLLFILFSFCSVLSEAGPLDLMSWFLSLRVLVRFGLDILARNQRNERVMSQYLFPWIPSHERSFQAKDISPSNIHSSCQGSSSHDSPSRLW